MAKVNISSGLASILLVASIFAGWPTLLLVTVLLFVFCELDPKVKALATKVITFYVVFTLITLGWDLLYEVVTVLLNTFSRFANMIELDIYEFMNFMNGLLATVSDIVGLLFLVVKFVFIVTILAGKEIKDNPITNILSGDVTKVLEFINSMEM